MSSGSLSVRVRPLRAAFLVDPNERGAVRKAIQAASTQWGGSFCPIVPAFRRNPRSWNVGHKPSSLIEGLVAGFDPDVVVTVGACQGRTFPVGHREVVPLEKFLGDDPMRPAYGVGMLKVLNSVVDAELKFLRNDQVRLTLPKLPLQFGLFMASVLGDLPEATMRDLYRYFDGVPGIERPKAEMASLPELLHPRNFFLRRAGMWKLQQPLRDPMLFVCDATSVRDVIDYWNLRASGRYVVPVPVQAFGSESMRNICRDFLLQHYQPRKYGSDHYFKATMQKSAAVTEDIVLSLCTSLGLSVGNDGKEQRFLVRSWLPRIWDEWARDNMDEGIVHAHSHEIDSSLQDAEARIDIRSQEPQFEWRDDYSGHPRYANDLSFRFYGSKEPMAEIFPPASKRMSTAIGRSGLSSGWRFSATGPVHLASMRGELVFLEPPKAEPVMKEWLADQGWAAKLSTSGRMALQMTRQLGGMFGVGLLRNQGLFEVLSALDREGGMPRPAIIGRLKQLCASQDHFDGEHYFQRLVEVGVLRLGTSIKCPVCTRHNWYELDQLSYKARCRFCLSEYDVPAHSPKDLKWTYRSYGPFSGTAAQGAISVLLTWHFLAGPHDAATTPIFSYVAKKGAKELEADLTCLYQSPGARKGSVRVIHAECKTFNSFEEVDVSRMKLLGEEFPGAVLVFAKVGEALSRSETGLIRALAEVHRKRRLAGRPSSPVVVLTGVELLSSTRAPHCWKGKGEPYKTVTEHWNLVDELEALSDATVQLYLSMPSWFDWVEKRRSQDSLLQGRRRKARGVRAA